MEVSKHTVVKEIVPGTKIRFIRTLDSPATEDHPEFIYATAGETGVVVEIGGCKEGYWVRTDRWPNLFGSSRHEFDIIE